jgi:hypothetical protein
LPQLSKSLAPHGYNLKFWYGGDEDFTNMRSYLINGGFAERVNDHSFPVSERLSKWGVHDHLLFSRAVREISNRRDSAPHLDVILSLSSHEPFEVPASQRFDNIYLNSIAYTDSCLGAFIDSLRCCPRWDSTLVVLVADHGYPYPATLQNFEPRRYHIPVIFCGGAVNAPVRIDRVCSQTDVVPTLLAQMGIDHVADHDIRKVSGGQLQRAAICRAMINHPDILLGDELTGALNSSSTQEVISIIEQINKKGTTVLLVTHDANVALHAGRIIYIQDGRIMDTLVLGEYDPKNVSERTDKMKKWLDEMKF